MGIDNYFTFAGVDCRRYGIRAFELETYGASAQEYDVRAIPGRDGDLLVPQERYPNRNMAFNCLIYEDSYTNLRNFRSWLLSQVGYKRLESSEHPDEFHLACFKGDIQPVKDKNSTAYKFELAFSAKPQRFLKSGERVVTLTSTGSIVNPTRYASKPLLRVYGTGRFDINSEHITITQTYEYMDIDCEIMECYKRAVSMNSKVQFSNNDFPTLQPGTNTITLGTGITKVEITPRWFVR